MCLKDISSAVGNRHIDMFSVIKRLKKYTVTVKIDMEPPDKTKMIDKNLQSMLRPLNMTQDIFLCAKYKIRDGIISANTSRYGLVSFVGLFIVIFSHLHTLWFDLTLGFTGRLGRFVKVGYTTYAVFIVLGFLMHYYLNMKHRHTCVELLIKLQNAHKIIKIDAKEYAKTNWVIVVALNCVFFVWLTVFYSTLQVQLSQVIKIYFTIIFDFNLIYVARLLKLFRICLEAWIKNVNNSGHIWEPENEHWIRIFNAFMDILEAYQLLEKTLGALVSVLSHSLIKFPNSILGTIIFLLFAACFLYF